MDCRRFFIQLPSNENCQSKRLSCRQNQRIHDKVPFQNQLDEKLSVDRFLSLSNQRRHFVHSLRIVVQGTSGNYSYVLIMIYVIHSTEVMEHLSIDDT